MAGNITRDGRVAVLSDRSQCVVMPGLVPGIHVFDRATRSKTWMAGTSPAMTEYVSANDPPHCHVDRADRDPDVVAAVGDDGGDGADSGVSARGHDLRDRRGGGVCQLHLAAGRVRRPE